MVRGPPYSTGPVLGSKWGACDDDPYHRPGAGGRSYISPLPPQPYWWGWDADGRHVPVTRVGYAGSPISTRALGTPPHPCAWAPVFRTVTQVYLQDSLNKRAYIRTFPDTGVFQTTLTQTGAGDAEAPKVTKLTMAPLKVDTSRTSARITITVREGKPHCAQCHPPPPLLSEETNARGGRLCCASGLHLALCPPASWTVFG